MASFIKRVAIGVVSVLLATPLLAFGQSSAPDLGAVAKFALFTPEGALANTGGSTRIIGDIGTNVGAISDYPKGSVVGQTYYPGTETQQAAVDVRAAYNAILATTSPAGPALAPAMGSGQVLAPFVYAFGGAASVDGDLILDGQGDPNARFVFKVNGAFSMGASARVLLVNGTKPQNVWWQVEGAASFAANAVMAGTIIAYGAVALGDGVTLWGRGLSTVGAVSTYNNRIAMPSAANPLPVELVAFTAALQGHAAVAVAWRTATEAHSARFEVERSTTGTAFARIGTVTAAGTSSTARAYALLDGQLPAGADRLYYRLRQVDADGTVAYSPVQVVTRTGVADAPLQAYPNPARGSEYVRVLGATAPLRVFNGAGQLVRTQSAAAAGAESVLPLAGLPAGLYLLRCGVRSQRLTVE